MPLKKPSIIPEARKNRECLDPSLIDEKLTTLAHDIEKRVEELTAVEALAQQSVRIGSKEIPVFPYKYFELREGGFQFTKKEYFAYVSFLIETPQDVVALINEPFMRWKEQSDEFNPLFDPPEVLGGGGADCDNISWTAKTLLDTLGCRDGHDYKARVIGMGTHAVCLYQNEQGEWWAIDQWDHHPVDLHNIRTASPMFLGPDSSLLEVFLRRPGLVHYVYLDLHTLESNHTHLNAALNAPYTPNVAPSDIFPEDWKTYEKAQISFQDGAAMIYMNGHLYQTDLPPSTDPHAPAVQFHNEAEIVIQQNLQDGTRENFTETGILLHQKFPSPNPIEILFYHEDGVTPSQCRYREGIDKTHYPYRDVWYAADGTTVIQTRDWEDKVELR